MVELLRRHVTKNGSREHVISWVSFAGQDGKTYVVRRCSCPSCVVNRRGRRLRRAARGRE